MFLFSTSINEIRLIKELYLLEKELKRRNIGTVKYSAYAAIKILIYHILIDIALIISIIALCLNEYNILKFSLSFYGLYIIDNILNGYYTDNIYISNEDKAKKMIYNMPKYFLLNNTEKEVFYISLLNNLNKRKS